MDLPRCLPGRQRIRSRSCTRSCIEQEKWRLQFNLELPADFPGKPWTLLEQNYMGEFGWKEILKQFLDEDRAKNLSVDWNGDIYATYEWKGAATRLLLVTRDTAVELRKRQSDFSDSTRWRWKRSMSTARTCIGGRTFSRSTPWAAECSCDVAGASA